jgi:cell division septation protein DedD
VYTAAEVRAEVRAAVERARAYLAERRAPATAFGVLLGASLLVWVVLLISTGGERTPQLATGGGVSAPAPADEGGAQPEGDVPLAPGQSQPPADTADTAGVDDVDDGEAAADTDAGELPHDAVLGEPDAEPGDGEVQVVDLDGLCRVEVEAGTAEARAPRAWEHPECEHAPLDPSRYDERWIVVVGSFSSADSARREARAWADRGGHDPQLLWSSHYPSLNPDLWVVYEGPYPHRHDATRAKDELGPGAYLRMLSVDGRSSETPPPR